MEGSTSLAKHSSLSGEGRICSQVWHATVTSKSVKSFHLPKDTNAQLNMLLLSHFSRVRLCVTP